MEKTHYHHKITITLYSIDTSFVASVSVTIESSVGNGAFAYNKYKLSSISYNAFKTFPK